MTTRQLIQAISLIFAWVVSVHHDWYKTIIPVVTQIRYPIVLATGLLLASGFSYSNSENVVLNLFLFFHLNSS